MPHHSTLDHHIVHQEQHGSRVRIVANTDVDETVAALKVLFPTNRCTRPRSAVITRASTGGRAGLARGRADLRASGPDCAQGDAEPAPLHPPGPRTAPEEPPPDYFGPDRGKP